MKNTCKPTDLDGLPLSSCIKSIKIPTLVTLVDESPIDRKQNGVLQTWKESMSISGLVHFRKFYRTILGMIGKLHIWESACTASVTEGIHPKSEFLRFRDAFTPQKKTFLRMRTPKYSQSLEESICFTMQNHRFWMERVHIFDASVPSRVRPLSLVGPRKAKLNLGWHRKKLGVPRDYPLVI